jgi:predicted TPR repeat methyltransferase
MDKEKLAQQAAENYRQGKFEESKQCLLELVKQGVESPALYNQLGIVANKLNAYGEANHFYQKALTLQPDHIDAMYNLALNLSAQEKVDESMASLLAVIKVEPGHVKAHFTLGKLLLEKKMLEKANEHFDLIVCERPDNQAYLSQIVAVLLQHQAYPLAQIYCERLHRLDPKNAEAIYNLAVIEAKQNHVAEAIEYYQQVLAIKPDHFPALNNLAVIYLEQKNKLMAQRYFEEALKLKPDNESVQYTLSVLKGDQSVAPPKAYIKDLFNHYADHYDAHLQKGLEYQVPDLLKNAVEKAAKDSKGLLDILDLGCGTGLSGEVFSGKAQSMIGVDLAEKMLDVAREKKCYQELVVADVEGYLTACDKQFDLIISADVFIYIGDLTKIFIEAYRCLQAPGFFAFSIELDKQQDYQTQASGRFSHAEKYIKRLAKETGFKIKHFKAVETRKQEKQAVAGAIVVLQK